jgi:indolepyruvate ferredoxin oxidoreductase, beta subunit
MNVVRHRGADLAPATLRELRDAALADEHGDKLRATLARHALG